MTQIQDLRIGNLVLSAKQVCTVTGLSKGTVEVNSNEWGSESAFDPIPLTEKILLDSGFKHIKGSAIVIFEKDDFSVEIRLNAEYAEIMFYFKGKQIPCKSTIYVHDLQNAFYIATGENLNIVIK